MPLSAKEKKRWAKRYMKAKGIQSLADRLVRDIEDDLKYCADTTVSKLEDNLEEIREMLAEEVEE